jgi:hypothetical protein
MRNHRSRPSIEEIKQLLDYDSETGIFIWKRWRTPSVLEGDIAGTANSKGHIQITINRYRYLATHIAWLFMTGDWPKLQIDHKDTDKSNNKWSNLREATHGQNRANSKSSAISGYKGVYKRVRGIKWYAAIRVNKELIQLGSFSSKIEAANAYREAAIKYHGEFARSDQ